jgi:mannitol/fructose-specific phosphotransferase system IIA component (Ntr-type)
MELITPDKVAVGVSVENWREAICVAGDLLIQCGAVKPEYTAAMIRMAEELGPYIVIAPGIAIPHARPEEGALKVAFVVVQLEPPVPFGNAQNDPVVLEIAFCSPDSNGHVILLSKIARAIGQNGFLERIKSARSPDELVAAFNTGTIVQP